MVIGRDSSETPSQTDNQQVLLLPTYEKVELTWKKFPFLGAGNRAVLRGTLWYPVVDAPGDSMQPLGRGM